MEKICDCHDVANSSELFRLGLGTRLGLALVCSDAELEEAELVLAELLRALRELARVVDAAVGAATDSGGGGDVRDRVTIHR